MGFLGQMSILILGSKKILISNIINVIVNMILHVKYWLNVVIKYL